MVTGCFMACRPGVRGLGGPIQEGCLSGVGRGLDSDVGVVGAELEVGPATVGSGSWRADFEVPRTESIEVLTGFANFFIVALLVDCTDWDSDGSEAVESARASYAALRSFTVRLWRIKRQASSVERARGMICHV